LEEHEGEVGEEGEEEDVRESSRRRERRKRRMRWQRQWQWWWWWTSWCRGEGGGCLLLSWSCVFFSLSREASKFLYNICALLYILTKFIGLFIYSYVSISLICLNERKLGLVFVFRCLIP
jgi:hypothetical protein